MKKIIPAVLAALIFLGCIPVCAEAESAKAFAVINGDTGELLYEKNKDERLAFASTTKIMTSLLLCEKFPDLSDAVKISQNAVNTEGTKMGLSAGDTVSAFDLLYGMMLPSGNDAANAAAEAVSGDIESFVSLMNRRAFEMGLINTHFDTPSGLDGKNHYTTALDLANLTRIALQNEQLKKAASTKTITLSFGTPKQNYYLKNHNKLLFMYDDIIGVKTGFTKLAGRCLVSAASRDGKYIIVVTLSDKNDWADHRALIDKGYELLGSKKRIKAPKDINLPLTNGEELMISLPEYTYFSSENINIQEKVFLPFFLYLPIEKGEEIGILEYFADYKSAKKIIIKSSAEKNAEVYGRRERVLAYLKVILRN